MLIKSPIGSGKSFLFFDGPIYGLYKYSARNILNIKSQEGFIKLLIEVNQEKYLIIRHIKKGKVKESCISKVYRIQGDIHLPTTQSPLQEDQDIEIFLAQQPQIQREEIQFKNETDVQQTLQTILPPREVIMNTIFLMQDSDNIFELTPTDRLTILKNVFNLMGIDDAKDILADKKREIRYKIKATTDISKYDQKLRTRIQTYLSIYKNTSETIKTDIDIQPYRDFFDEREQIASKITITDFSLRDFPTNLHTQLETWLSLQNTSIQKLTHQIQTLRQEQQSHEQKTQEKQQLLTTITTQKTQIQEKLSTLDEATLLKTKEQKQLLIQQQQEQEHQLPKEIIWNFIQTYYPVAFIHTPNDINIQTCYHIIQEVINQGKNLTEEIKNMQLQIQNNDLIQKNQQEKYMTQRTHILDKITDQNKQISAVEELLHQIDQNMQEQEFFACEKIKEPCPFIKVINKKTFDQLESQKQTIKEQQATYTKQKNLLQQSLQELEAHPITSNQEQNTTLTLSIQHHEQQKEQIKTFLQEVAYKEREQEYLAYTKRDKEIKQLDTLIHTQEQHMQQREERKQQLQTYRAQQEQLQQQIKELQDNSKQKDEEYQRLLTQQSHIDHTRIQTIEKNYREMTQLYHDIDTLINDFKTLQVEKKQLEEQETIINNLYTIFAKELLLLVVQDHLPTINDIINNYLAQIVSYQINLQLNKSDADKIELEAKIIDEKWMRDTKSLSGGQRIILKLIRMLAISSYINSPILFLDETINNLDAETIGKVADILENFVKQKNMKFYTITHSQQIQEMDIWDHTIQLQSIWN